MNWRRGLLRAWVVISALWVLGSVAIGASELLEIFVPTEHLPKEGAVGLPAEQYACWVIRHGDNPFVTTLPIDEAWKQCTKYRLRVPVIALLPPLIVLALGYACRWVWKGFE
jgi:hypothetical protein